MTLWEGIWRYINLYSRPRASLESDAHDYAERLLADIKLMLSYVNENGITLPDDLRSKIAMLLRGEIPAKPVTLVSPADVSPPATRGENGI